MGDDGEFDYFECPDCGFDSVQRADLGWVIVECEARITELEGERDTATRALEAIGSLAVMSEGNVAGGVVSSREVDAIINAALSKTEGKG